MPTRAHTFTTRYYYTGWQRATRKNPISTVFVPLVKTKGENFASRFFSVISGIIFYYLISRLRNSFIPSKEETIGKGEIIAIALRDIGRVG